MLIVSRRTLNFILVVLSISKLLNATANPGAAAARSQNNIRQREPWARPAAVPGSFYDVATQLRGGSVTASVPEVKAFMDAVDLFGTAVFAFSGAVTAGQKGMDLLGMIVIATITAVGGGTMRDFLLDSGTVFWIRVPIYFKICLVTAISTYLIWPILERRMSWNASSKLICGADAFGLGAFAVLGTQKGSEFGLAPLMWVVTGTVSSTFGGITRDVLCLQAPRVMYPTKSLYATAPMIGSIIYTTLINKFDTSVEIASWICFTVTFLSRVYFFNSDVRMPHWDVPSWSQPQERINVLKSLSRLFSSKKKVAVSKNESTKPSSETIGYENEEMVQAEGVAMNM